MVEDTLQNKLYIDSLKALEKHGKVAEHHRRAIDTKEIDFMRDVQKEVTKSSLIMPYKTNQYETIFKTKRLAGFLP